MVSASAMAHVQFVSSAAAFKLSSTADCQLGCIVCSQGAMGGPHPGNVLSGMVHYAVEAFASDLTGNNDVLPAQALL